MCYYCFVFSLFLYYLIIMDQFKEKIRELYNKGDWRGILSSLHEEKRWSTYVLWVQPLEENLQFMALTISRRDLKGIVSIGCGTGLLEWLLQSSTGLKVIGIEVERNYWKSQSKHNGNSFIPHVYPDDDDYSYYCQTNSYALMFCYFNYREPFNKYINNYKGNCIIIIGPGPGRGTHTDPEPFNPKFNEDKWVLKEFQEMGNTKDFIVVYTKDETK